MQKLTIFDLPKDIIKCHIFDELTFAEVLNISQTCRYFRDILLIMYRKKYDITYIPRMSCKDDVSLYDHQVSSIRWMIEREKNPHHGVKGGILALSMGLGKTLTSIMLILCTLKKGQPTLVVTSKPIMEEWKKNIEKFFGKRVRALYLHNDYCETSTIENVSNYNIVVTTYDVVCNISTKYIEKCLERDERDRIIGIHLAKFPSRKTKPCGADLIYTTRWMRVITDESQRFNNSKTKLFKAMMAICATNRWCITGTPVRNSHSDMYSLFKFLGFTKCENDRVWESDAVYVKYNLAKCILSLSYNDAGIKLPGKIIHNIKLNLDRENQQLYEILKYDAQQKYQHMTRYGAILVGLLRMRQLCITSRLVATDKNFSAGLKDKCENVKSHPKIKVFKHIVDARIPKDDKIIVFSSFRETFKFFMEGYEGQCIELSAETKGADRRNVLNRFENDPKIRILFMTYKTGSEGLTLTVANHIILLDPWWTPVVHNQAIARAWRIGQKKQVHVWNLLVKDTIDTNIIDHIHMAKQMAIDEYDMTRLNKAMIGKILMV